MVEAGKLYRVYISTLIGGNPKDKYCVLICLNPKLRLLLISSEIPDFILEHKQLSQAQVLIDAARHPFLNYDSYIDCSDPYGYPDNFNDHIDADNTRVLCDLQDDVLINIRTAIAQSYTISPKQIGWILEELPKPDGSTY